MTFWSRIRRGSQSRDGEQDSRRPLIDPNIFAPAIHGTQGLPRVDWQQARNIAAQHCRPDDIAAGLQQATRYWLEAMAATVGPQYRVFEDSDFFILLPGGPSRASRITAAVKPAWRLIEKLMTHENPAAPGNANLQKRAILIFDNPERYYDYICVFYPDQEKVFGTSSGVYVSEGYPHIVLNAGGNAVSLQTLVHELTHSAVDNLPLPRWLNEGLAQQMEDLVRPAHRPFLLTPREVRVQQRYWKWFGIQRFWIGSSFYVKGGQRPSYQLSEVMVRSLIAGRGRNGLFKQFLLHANRRDAGEEAARKFLACGVGDLVAEFLGVGDWSPLP